MKYIPVSLLKQFNILNLIYMAAQRQVGETALNDNSSRSHQIIRLVSDSTIICWNSKDYLIFLSLITYGNNFLFYSFLVYIADNSKYSSWKCWLCEIFCCNLGNWCFPLVYFWMDKLVLVEQLMSIIAELCWSCWKWEGCTNTCRWH